MAQKSKPRSSLSRAFVTRLLERTPRMPYDRVASRARAAGVRVSPSLVKDVRESLARRRPTRKAVMTATAAVAERARRYAAAVRRPTSKRRRGRSVKLRRGPPDIV